MATRTRIGSNNTENLFKNIDGLKQKSTIVNKGVPKLTQRAALGDRTNKETTKPDTTNVLKKLVTKHEEKKHVSVTSQIAKPKVISKSNISNLVRPTAIPSKVIAEKENLKIAAEKQVAENKKLPYSVEHFGLEERDLDPQLVSEYINDIVGYLKELEAKYVVGETFLTSSKTSPRMRTVLISWLVDVHLNFNLVQETLFLTVSIIDRYLQKDKKIGRENLQLVGITALCIAAKYEEIYAPDIDDLVYICDNLFTRKDILKMEKNIINTLNFNFGSPCALHFLRRYSKVAKVEPQNHILAKYLIELTLIDHKYSSFKPSLLAASALTLSIQLLNLPNDSEMSLNTILVASGYKLRDILPIIRNLAASVLAISDSKYQSVKTKYESKTFNKISLRTELKGDMIKKLAANAVTKP